MAEIKKYLHTLDIGNNKIINLLLNPLTTSQRTTVGSSLTTADEGYVCYDTDENVQYFWDGTTWVASGGGGSQTLQDVTDLGNTTTNNIQLLNAAETIYGAGGGILLDNGSRLREGTINAGLGGSKGIAQICAVGYELKWEAGRLYVMNGNGTGIRQSLYNFTTTPTVADDSLLGYAVGSLWTLDDGTVYECADATIGAAVWTLVEINPTSAAGGDLSGNYPNPTVDGLQGNAVSATTPTSGQILQWNTSANAWVPGAVPTGGSGGGGITYYFNYQNTTGISPTTGLPTSPVAPSQLGISYSVGAGSIDSANLTNGTYIFICGFVTIVGTPGITDIPAGLWDFNIWADVVGHNGSANQTQFQIRVYKYDGTTGVYTSLANSDDIYVYDPNTIAQYIGNVTMPQTTLLSTDRIYIEFWAQKNVNQSRQISFHFDSLHPSHVHTTIPSVAGTGLVKVVNGVYQSPATLLVDADVSASAAIAISKLSMNTNKLLGRGTASAGAVEEITLGTNLSLSGTTLNTTGLLSTLLTSTNIFVGNGSNIATGVSLTLDSATGSFGLSNTGVLTIPDASASVRGFVNISAQTFAGLKSFSSIKVGTYTQFGSISSLINTNGEIRAGGGYNLRPPTELDNSFIGLKLNGAQPAIVYNSVNVATFNSIGSGTSGSNILVTDTGYNPTTGSGTVYGVRINSSITPPNGSNTISYNFFASTPTINQQTFGTGIIRGFYHAPTLTNLGSSIHRAWENLTGDCIFGSTSGSVGIGATTTINASAILQVTSTTKGFLPPRTTRASVSSAVAGLMIYDTGLNKLCVYNGTTWEVITSV